MTVHVARASQSHRRRSTGQDAANWTPALPTSNGGVLPEHWYDANQIVGIADGNPVPQWDDETANADHVTQGAGANQPLWIASVAGIGNMPAVRLDGANDYLQGAFTTGGALSQPLSVFAVAALDVAAVNDGNHHELMDGDDNTNRIILQQNNAAAPDDWQCYAGSKLNGAASNSDWNTWLFLANGGSSEFWHNGISEDAGNAGTKVLDGITIGAGFDGATPWDGDIAEILIYDSNLSTADKNEVGNYLATKYGLSWTTIV